MQLAIHSLQQTLFDAEVRSVVLQTPLGEITILENHLPLITPLARGKIRLTNLQNQEQIISLEGGVVEVRPGSEVVILAEEKIK